MGQPLLNTVDLDDVLGKFSVSGRYHAVSGISLFLGITLNVMWYMNFVFVTEKVGYRCADHLIPQNRSKSLNTSTIEWCVNPASCSKWVYDNPNSFVAEFQLACHEWKRTFIGGVQGFGHIVGLLIIGPLSDRFGRKPLAVITGVSGGVLGLAKSWTNSYWHYVMLEFLEAGLGDSISPLFTLAIEMVATKSRVTYTTICNAAFSGGTLVVLIAWLVPYWRTLLRVLYAPGLLLFIVLCHVLDESPRWLLSKGRKKEAVEIIRNAAKQNKLHIEENLDMISYEKNNGMSFVTVIRSTFRSRTILKRFIVCTIWWIACNFATHGLAINSVTLPGNKYVNFALSAVMRFPSSLLIGYIIIKFNRKGPLLLFFVVCAVICVGQPFISKGVPWLLVLTYMMGKMTATMCLNAVYIYTSELFPTHTRNSMHNLCSSMGRIGAIMSTQTPLLMEFWSGLPTLMFGAVAFIAGLVTLLMPDTADQNLPDTVCQAEALEYTDSNKNEI